MKTTEHRWICPNTASPVDERLGPTHISQHKLIWQHMEHISIDDVEPGAFGNDIDCRSLSTPLGTTDVAINHYRLAPGEGFPGGLHAHMDQEEVFVIIEGEATFEMMDGEVTVSEGEAIRFAPGEFQSGINESEDNLAAVAMGAPRESEDVRIPLRCPECDHDHLRLETDTIGATLVCPNCDVEHIPEDCPECGHDDLRVAIDEETQTVVICPDCGVEFENPPFRGR